MSGRAETLFYEGAEGSTYTVTLQTPGDGRQAFTVGEAGVSWSKGEWWHLIPWGRVLSLSSRPTCPICGALTGHGRECPEYGL